MRIYLDSAAVIYTVEQVKPYAEMVDSRLSGGDVMIVTSDLTRLEWLRGMESGRRSFPRAYEALSQV